MIARVSFLELARKGAHGRIGFVDLQDAAPAAHGRISWLDLEASTVAPEQAHGRVSFVDLSVEQSDHGRVSFVELSVGTLAQPVLDTQGRNWGGLGGDSSAYTPHQVKQRIQAVVIDGTSYDPFADNLIEILEASAWQTTASPAAKLARTFTVVSPEASIEVPLFRPMLDSMPNFKTAIAQDFEAYTQLAKIEIEDEQRRIILLLSDFSFA